MECDLNEGNIAGKLFVLMKRGRSNSIFKNKEDWKIK
jgi:hypothetical protein